MARENTDAHKSIYLTDGPWRPYRTPGGARRLRRPGH